MIVFTLSARMNVILPIQDVIILTNKKVPKLAAQRMKGYRQRLKCKQNKPSESEESFDNKQRYDVNFGYIYFLKIVDFFSMKYCIYVLFDKKIDINTLTHFRVVTM